ncbi:MAG: response regulator, partial [Desulfobacteraceae bacterium]|nr:response regulator [Desulfobacteraceae bacterium]
MVRDTTQRPYESEKQSTMVAPKRILVVDDEVTIRESCRRIFSEQGYDVQTAASAKEGLEHTRRGYFDCALIDLKLPDTDGMEIVRLARENRGNMAVLIITGYG